MELPYPFFGRYFSGDIPHFLEIFQIFWGYSLNFYTRPGFFLGTSNKSVSEIAIEAMDPWRSFHGHDSHVQITKYWGLKKNYPKERKKMDI